MISRVRFKETLKATALAAAIVGLVSACSGGSPETKPTPKPEPKGEVTLQTLGNEYRGIETTLIAVPAESSGNPVGGTVVYKLSWKNTAKKEFKGGLGARLVAPTGWKIVKDGGCRKALINDLTCDFTGYLTPGSSTFRYITYTANSH